MYGGTCYILNSSCWLVIINEVLPLQEGFASEAYVYGNDGWVRVYFMSFYIITLVSNFGRVRGAVKCMYANIWIFSPQNTMCSNISFSDFSVGFCINEEKGYLLPKRRQVVFRARVGNR